MSSALQGILQGLTEYLPVSSSAHLSIYQHIAGNLTNCLTFDLVLHLATVLATLIYFYHDIIDLICGFFSGFTKLGGPKKEGWYFGWAVIAGSVPTAVLGLTLKPLVARAAESMPAVGFALLVTSAMLFIISRVHTGNRKITITTGFLIGIAQGMAVFPGISRSGATLFAGLILGLSAEEAFRFSFLLSVPAILGAGLLEALSLSDFSAVSITWSAGFVTSFIFGLAALAVLHRVVVRGRWLCFSLYCAVAGFCALFIL